MLDALRSLMAQKGIDAYVVPPTDPHVSEYLPEHWRGMRQLSGFTGSAGMVVVTQDFAGLWTDSRYFVQAERQLAGSGFELMKLRVSHTPEYLEWLAEKLLPGSVVACDGKVFALSAYRALERALKPKGFILDPGADLLGEIWSNRPALPAGQVREHDPKFAGQTRKQKLQQIRAAMEAHGADYTVVATLDDIAWTFNLRGSDVPFNPLFVAYALIGKKDAHLFVAPEKIPAALAERLKKDGLQLQAYEAITAFLNKIPKGKTVYFDPARVSQSLPGALGEGVKTVEGLNLSTALKACKTAAEAAHTRKTMISDGVALTKFFYWLSQTVGKKTLTELDAAAKLHELRAAQPNCVGESFNTISAYGENAALPHYAPSPESNATLQARGLYLLDSGGQYLGGTTDTTRVLSLGDITAQEKRDYTLVLKGMLAVCSLQFPAGTKGRQIDALAREPLWREGINFGHGTGHGVGYYLNVHEGPQSISTGVGNPDAALQPGMITSVEPGIYRVGQYGIRLENLVLCVEKGKNEFGEWHGFEVLTLAPLFTNLVDKKLMSKFELNWLRQYNQLVIRKIGKFLEPEELAWVKAKTRI